MIIDAHIHIWERKMLPDEAVRSYLEPIRKFQEMYGGVFDLGLNEKVPFSDYVERVDEIVDSMNMNNIDYSVVLGTDFELVGGDKMTNYEYMDWMIQTCSTDDRFVPFISVDPNRGEKAYEMMRRLVKKYDPIGLKLYPATGFYPDDPKLERYWDLVDELGLVVTTHTGMALPPLDEKFCHPSNLKAVAEKHPDVKIIVAHLGGKFHDELFPLMDACDNVYTDCSALQGWFLSDKTMIDKRLESVTSRYPDRVVWGTDSPLYEVQMPTSMYIQTIREAEWGNEKVKNDLLGNTMKKLLGF